MSRRIPLQRYRNIGIVAHIDAGKTTVTERILFHTGVSARMGEVHDGSAIMDWMPEEQERGISITAAATTCFWSGVRGRFPEHHINIIDTPGHVDFTVEVERSLRVLDGAVVVLCAASGVQSQTDTVWRQASRHRIPRVAFVNKMDRTGADYGRTLTQLRDKFGAVPVPVHAPLITNGEFIGVMDLIRMRSITRCASDLGTGYRVGAIPDAERALYQMMHERLIEAAAEATDELTGLYVNGLGLSEEQILHGLRLRTLRAEIVPVTCGSALRNIGIEALLDAVVDFLPAPTDIPPAEAITRAGAHVRCTADDSEPFAALVFKLAHDPEYGELAFLRVYSGHLVSGSAVLNARTGEILPSGHLVRVHANEYEEIREIFAGDIGAIAGLDGVRSGDTLCHPLREISLESLSIPEPVISVAVEPRTLADGESLASALVRFTREDPSLKVHEDPESGQIILSGMGELHLEIVIDRIRREYGIDARVGRPRVAFRETISSAAEAEGKCIREVAGRGIYARIRLRLEPLPPSSEYEFESRVAAQSIPDTFLAAIYQSVQQQLEQGTTFGYPLRAIRVIVIDGSWHETDSNPEAFRAAAAMAFRDGLRRAAHCLLEPVMSVEVSTPESFMGAVIGELSRRRGVIQAINDVPAGKAVAAEVPLSEMFGYATSLRSATQGLATYSMEFRAYAEIPESIAATIVARKTS